MATAESNLDEIADLLRRLATCVDFTRAGAEKTLGESCLDRVSERCQDRSIDEQKGARGNGWAENAPAYKKTKKKKGKPIGVLTGEMLSDVQLQGKRTIEPMSARMVYGTTPEARDKASWFSQGSTGDGESDGPHSGAKNQPPRPGMYQLDDIARQDVMDEIGEFFEFIKGEGQI